MKLEKGFKDYSVQLIIDKWGTRVLEIYPQITQPNIDWAGVLPYHIRRFRGSGFYKSVFLKGALSRVKSGYCTTGGSFQLEVLELEFLS